jgi:hypothetical protein
LKADLEGFGIDAQAAAAWLGTDDEPEYFEVLPENWLTLRVFLAMVTQWIWTGGMESRRAGLNYLALPIVYDALGVSTEDRPDVFEGLRVMEIEALDVLTKA